MNILEFTNENVIDAVWKKQILWNLNINWSE